MRRTTVLLALLIAMLWQSVAMARIGSTVDPLADLQHAVLHWQDQAHHHGDDGTYRLDDSGESVQHVLCDHLCATAAPLMPTSHEFPPPGSAAPGGLHEALVPDPALDGLLRPPQRRA